ncbi:hypothetical protein [Calothrix sp. FACHB-168]|uniref:hypothetical protein n=1 Tax=Calothrix sp. FACHB-168 TaxID=2692780 RepID=UPI0016865B07|nr:hypothetical protein [Calothrix sp. FACHB-168]MBD2208118.1 hypothetical protein [Calothrix sp. FACHB-168]
MEERFDYVRLPGDRWMVLDNETKVFSHPELLKSLNGFYPPCPKNIPKRLKRKWLKKYANENTPTPSKHKGKS